MTKQILAIILAAATITGLSGAMESNTTSKRSPGQADRGVDNRQVLHQGMTMSDVRQALGATGSIWKVDRIRCDASDDPSDWNVEWRISSIFLSNRNTADYTVSFGAWSPDGSSDRPPDSAFRLVEWRNVG